MYRAKRAALSPKVKRRVGKYELGRTIGEGTFAKVRFARNTENHEPVAIKILDKEKVQKHRLVEQVSIRQFLFWDHALANFLLPIFCQYHDAWIKLQLIRNIEVKSLMLPI
jgi:serine/threonine protein kinase